MLQTRMCCLILLTLVYNTQKGSVDAYNYCKEKGKEHLFCGTKKFDKRCGRLEDVRLMRPTEIDKQVILKAHNNYRKRIALGLEKKSLGGPMPKASNMIELEWDDELEYLSHNFLKMCYFEHSTIEQSTVERFTTGENLHQLRHGVFLKPEDEYSWQKVVDAWNDEITLFDSGDVSYLKKENRFNHDFEAYGHLTQDIWADTKVVGCGRVRFKNSQPMWEILSSCHYGPTGNYMKKPIYSIGNPCSKCPQGYACSKTFQGICKNVTYTMNKRKPPGYDFSKTDWRKRSSASYSPAFKPSKTLQTPLQNYMPNYKRKQTYNPKSQNSNFFSKFWKKQPIKSIQKPSQYKIKYPSKDIYAYKKKTDTNKNYYQFDKNRRQKQFMHPMIADKTSPQKPSKKYQKEITSQYWNQKKLNQKTNIPKKYWKQNPNIRHFQRRFSNSDQKKKSPKLHQSSGSDSFKELGKQQSQRQSEKAKYWEQQAKLRNKYRKKKRMNIQWHGSKGSKPYQDKVEHNNKRGEQGHLHKKYGYDQKYPNVKQTENIPTLDLQGTKPQQKGYGDVFKDVHQHNNDQYGQEDLKQKEPTANFSPTHDNEGVVNQKDSSIKSENVSTLDQESNKSQQNGSEDQLTGIDWDNTDHQPQGDRKKKKRSKTEATHNHDGEDTDNGVQNSSINSASESAGISMMIATMLIWIACRRATQRYFS